MTQGPGTGSSRVIRGGDWYYYAGFCRPAFRSRIYPDGSDITLGFRAVLAPGRP